ARAGLSDVEVLGDAGAVHRVRIRPPLVVRGGRRRIRSECVAGQGDAETDGGPFQHDAPGDAFAGAGQCSLDVTFRCPILAGETQISVPAVITALFELRNSDPYRIGSHFLRLARAHLHGFPTSPSDDFSRGSYDNVVPPVNSADGR